MDLKVYGGWPIRIKQISVNMRMDDRGPVEKEVLDLNQAAESFAMVLEEAQHMKDQLRAHDELSKTIESFAGVVGEGAQYVPEKVAVGHIDPEGRVYVGGGIYTTHQEVAHTEDAKWMGKEDKSVWPHDPSTWPKGTLGAPELSHGTEFSHTSFSKLTERVQRLEVQLERLKGNTPGLGY